jgi:hypothetical protein
MLVIATEVGKTITTNTFQLLVRATFRLTRTDWFRFGCGAFVPGGSQLHGTGSLALLTPMPLRTVQALPHSAIVANENLFSHANLVSTSGRRLCQVLFSAPRRRRPPTATRF